MCGMLTNIKKNKEACSPLRPTVQLGLHDKCHGCHDGSNMWVLTDQSVEFRHARLIDGCAFYFSSHLFRSIRGVKNKMRLPLPLNIWVKKRCKAHNLIGNLFFLVRLDFNLV